MKRKLIYTIIFISIFLMSSASMVTPVQGYEPPDIPAEAKGMTLDDTEVTVYDEDGLEDSLGKGFDIKDIKDGDADIVGARSQYKIIDWETDEDLVDYEKDYVYGAVDFEVAAVGIRGTFWALGNTTQSASVAPLAELMKDISPVVNNATFTFLGTAADTAADASILTWAEILNLYSQSYDGTILDRWVWNLLDPAEEFDPNDPDVDDDEVPFLLDPRDWRSSWDNLAALRDYILGTAMGIQTAFDNWYGFLYSSLPPSNYTAINSTINGLKALGPEGLALVWALGNISLPYSGGAVIDYPLGMYLLATYVTQQVIFGTKYAIPTKAGYLLSVLEAGQPCCGPAEDFIKRAVKEFYINEGPWRLPWVPYGEDFLGAFGAVETDLAISAIPYGTSYWALGGWPVPLGGETIYVSAEIEIEVDDAGTVTYNIEYADNQQDPKDILRNTAEYRTLWGTPFETDPDELDDWEYVFPKASDAPTQIKDGDTILYETTPMEGPIPGYEIPVIIGVALASVIGLIYVVMKKRK